MTRTAISPRFAIRTFLSTSYGGRNRGFDARSLIEEMRGWMIRRGPKRGSGPMNGSVSPMCDGCHRRVRRTPTCWRSAGLVSPKASCWSRTRRSRGVVGWVAAGWLPPVRRCCARCCFDRLPWRPTWCLRRCQFVAHTMSSTRLVVMQKAEKRLRLLRGAWRLGKLSEWLCLKVEYGQLIPIKATMLPVTARGNLRGRLAA